MHSLCRGLFLCRRVGSFSALLFACLALCTLSNSPSAFAQKGKKKPEPEVKAGKVVSVEKNKKGQTVVKVKLEGSEDELEIPITPKTPLEITAKGDDGFLKPNVTISAEVFTSNQKFFGKDFKAFLNTPGPQLFVNPNQMDPSRYDICLKIVALENDGAMIVNFLDAGPKKVYAEVAGQPIDVIVSDVALVKDEADVEVEGHSVRGGKSFNATKIRVKLEEPLVSAEYFAKHGGDKKESSKTKSKPSVKSKEAKTKDKGDSAEPSDDPFGVLGKRAKDKPKKEEKTDK